MSKGIKQETMAPTFDYTDNLEQFILVCWCEIYETKDDDEKKEMRKEIVGNRVNMEGWIEEHIINEDMVQNKNLRYAIINTIDIKKIIKDIKEDEYFDDFQKDEDEWLNEDDDEEDGENITFTCEECLSK